MTFELRKNPAPSGTPQTPPRSDESAYSLSPQPVIADRFASSATTTAQAIDLPRSYHAEALYLLPRDPHSLYAYWDIDWNAAFGEPLPKERKVYLRVLNADGSEHAAMEVEPMAGSCYVALSAGGESYTADIGYYQPAGVWTSVAKSAAINSPPKHRGGTDAGDYATVPFHLSFQRMIDVFRVSKHETESLASMLLELRERAAIRKQNVTFTLEERELVRVMNEAAAHRPPAPDSAPAPDLWVRYGLDRVLGFGGASPTDGFGGSSRAS